MAHPCVTALEMLAMIVGMVAWFCSLAATLMPQWLTFATALLALESYERGLWENCLVQEVAGTECREFDSLLGLPPSIILARILMCTADALGILSLLIAVPGLSIVKGCGGRSGRRIKRGIKITAGILILFTGFLVLVPVSHVAHKTVERFFDENLPHEMPRWEFGDALFVGWSAGLLYIVASLLFFASCVELEDNEMQMVYHHHHHQDKVNTLRSERYSPRKHAEYV